MPVVQLLPSGTSTLLFLHHNPTFTTSRSPAPFEIVIDKVKVYQSDTGHSDWICRIFTDESRQLLWWSQALEDFGPLEQSRVALMVKLKYGIEIELY